MFQLSPRLIRALATLARFDNSPDFCGIPLAILAGAVIPLDGPLPDGLGWLIRWFLVSVRNPMIRILYLGLSYPTEHQG